MNIYIFTALVLILVFLAFYGGYLTGYNEASDNWRKIFDERKKLKGDENVPNDTNGNSPGT